MHDEEDLLLAFKDVIELHNELMIGFIKDLPLIFDIFELSVVDDEVFSKGLHCVFVIGRFVSHQIYLCN